MKLILEAIKAMFRKAEMGVSKLAGRVTELEKRIPKPGSKDQAKFLRGDGTWADPGVLTIQTWYYKSWAGDTPVLAMKPIEIPKGTYRLLKDAAFTGKIVPLYVVCHYTPLDSNIERIQVCPLFYEYADYRQNGGTEYIAVYRENPSTSGKVSQLFSIFPNDSTDRR